MGWLTPLLSDPVRPLNSDTTLTTKTRHHIPHFKKKLLGPSVLLRHSQTTRCNAHPPKPPLYSYTIELWVRPGLFNYGYYCSPPFPLSPIHPIIIIAKMSNSQKLLGGKREIFKALILYEMLLLKNIDRQICDVQ